MPSLPAVRDAFRALLIESGAATHPSYTLTAVVFGAAVEATFDAGAASFALQIGPVDARPCYRRTQRFNIGFRGKTLDQRAYAVVDAACAAVARWEQSSVPGSEALLFTPPSPSQDGHRFELFAVRCGVKPSCRIVVPPRAGNELIDAARGLGLHACRVGARRYSGSVEDLAHLQRTEATALVLVARSAAELDALARAEAVDSAPAEVGALLGYPPCCVDVFAAQNTLPKPAIRFMALQQTNRPASYLLNDLDGKAGLVSHLVCRYDCAPSIEIAGAVLAEFARDAPEEAKAFAASLRGLVVAFAEGGTLRLELEPEVTPPRFRIAAVHAVGDGPSIWSWREALVGADAVEVGDGSVVVFAQGRELQRLETPGDQVQVRVFA